MMKKIFFLFLVLFVFSKTFLLFSAPQETLPFQVKESLSQDKAFVADPITGQVRISSAADLDISIEAFPQGIPDFEILDKKESSRIFWGRKKTRLDFKIAGLKSGVFKIPAVTIRYKTKNQKDWKTYQTPEVLVVIRSVLEEDEGERQMKGIKGPWLPFDRRIAFVVIFIILTGVFLWLRGCKKHQNKTPEVKPEAHVIALQKIRELERQDLPSRGLVKEFFIEISLIIRHYLEDRFLLRAPEMTTEEFLLHLKETDMLNLDQKKALKGFLLACDKVKFAKYEPTDIEIQDVLRGAKQLIEETRPQPLAEKTL